jgi:hypothetical protein
MLQTGIVLIDLCECWMCTGRLIHMRSISLAEINHEDDGSEKENKPKPHVPVRPDAHSEALKD